MIESRQLALDALASARAVFSPDRIYRYALWREWGETPEAITERALFVMLNPSTADSEKDDPTIRRCIRFAQGWGYGALDVANLFALRSTDPAAVKGAPEHAIGPENDGWIRHLADRASVVVCAWGVHGGSRALSVENTLRDCGKELFCLGITKEGHPRHPLYVPKDTGLCSWQPRV